MKSLKAKCGCTSFKNLSQSVLLAEDVYLEDMVALQDILTWHIGKICPLTDPSKIIWIVEDFDL